MGLKVLGEWARVVEGVRSRGELPIEEWFYLPKTGCYAEPFCLSTHDGILGRNFQSINS